MYMYNVHCMYTAAIYRGLVITPTGLQPPSEGLGTTKQATLWHWTVCCQHEKVGHRRQ